ncbi:glycosyltransferase [bacterium]|nr:glycosyltransferase [bacterium]
MKILHINSVYNQGGAALLMRILAKNIETNQDVDQFFIVKESSDESTEKIFQTKNIPSFFGYKKFSRIMSEQGFLYRFLLLEARFILKKAREISPDIIHLHNLHGRYFQTNLLLKLSKIAPIVWTFHDMFPITGHCAYSFECEKWKTGCGNCERLDIYPSIKKDRTNALWHYKNNIFNYADFTIVTPSLWLKKCVEQSFLKNKDIRLIYNGIDLKNFKKTDKSEARKALKLPEDKKIVLFSANGGVKNPFKGGEFVFQAFEKLKNRNDILFLNIGGKNKEKSDNWLDFGYVKEPKTMAKIYSASDIYLFPTLADNCPLTAIESLACELPVVTFETGGVPEIVENNKSGFVVEYKNGEMLTSALEKLLDNNDLRERMSENAIQASKKFSSERMALEYLKLYEELLK